MAELQTLTLDVEDEHQESDSLTLRLERDHDRHSALAEQRGALVCGGEGRDSVEALTSCLKQVSVVNATRRIIACRYEGDALIDEAQFAKACRDAEIDLAT